MLKQIVVHDPSCISGDSLAALFDVVTGEWPGAVMRLYHLEGAFDPRAIEKQIQKGVMPPREFASFIRGKAQVDWATVLVARDSSQVMPVQIGRGHVPALIDDLILIRGVDGTFIDIITPSRAIQEKVVMAYPGCSVNDVAEHSIDWPE
jgi:hypothetical protein